MKKIKVLLSFFRDENSKITLSRVYKELSQVDWIDLHVIGYFSHMPEHIPYEFNMDCLLDIYSNRTINRMEMVFQKEHFLFNQYMKDLKPDIVLTDFDFYTTDAAICCEYPIVAISSKIIQINLMNSAHSSLPHKFQNRIMRLFLCYYDMCKFLEPRRLCYSHVGDMCEIRGYDHIIRPYHEIYEDTQSDKVLFLFRNALPHIEWLKKYKNHILYTESPIFIEGMKVRNMFDDEYFEDLSACKYIVSDGNEMAACDAYYNKKYTYIINHSFSNFDSDVFESFKFQSAYIMERNGRGKIIRDDIETMDLASLDFPRLKMRITKRKKSNRRYVSDITTHLRQRFFK